MPNVDSLFRKYEVNPAVAASNPKYNLWVKSVATEVDLQNPQELELVRDLSMIMGASLPEYKWAAVSSNNLYWNATKTPIRVVAIPHPEEGIITLVNPEITLYGGLKFDSVEECGSFPGNRYSVKRSSYVRVFGHLLLDSGGFHPAEFEYGFNGASLDEILRSKEQQRGITNSAYVQHEIDHINGKVIPKKGKVYREPTENSTELLIFLAAMQEFPI